MKTMLFILGVIVGISASPYLAVYRVSCDTQKYGWMWGTQARFDSEGLTCRGNENQQVQREKSPYMVLQTIALEIGP